MKAKAIVVLAVATLALCASSAFAKKAERETVIVLDQQSSTAAYDWYVSSLVSQKVMEALCRNERWRA